MRWTPQGCVYVIWRDDGAHKIGFTSNMTRRLKNLRKCSGHEMRVVHTLDCQRDVRAVEKEAHRILALHRLSGEWFVVTAKEAISAVSLAAARVEYRSIPTRQANRLTLIEKIEGEIGRALTRAEISVLEASGQFGDWWAVPRGQPRQYTGYPIAALL